MVTEFHFFTQLPQEIQMEIQIEIWTITIKEPGLLNLVLPEIHALAKLGNQKRRHLAAHRRYIKQPKGNAHPGGA
jgi:hypothetical protein